MKEKKKGRILLFIAMVLGILYAVFSIQYWGGEAGAGVTDSAEQIGVGLATAIVMPHLICEMLAVLFNTLGFFMYYRPFALVAAILYTVALVLFPVYFMFVVIQMILCYIAFARMKKQ